MKNGFLIISTLLIAGCMRPDYQKAPQPEKSEPGCVIEITQVINSNEVLADGRCYYSCEKNTGETFSCTGLASSDFGHFSINAKNVVDGDRLHYSSIKRVGTYKYTNTMGATKTVPDYKTANVKSTLDSENKKALDEYNAKFPEKERKNYQPIFYLGKELEIWNILSPVIYTPISLVFSPLCLFDSDCYITLNRLNDKTISTPYKDR